MKYSTINIDGHEWSYEPICPPRADMALQAEGHRLILRHGKPTKIVLAEPETITAGWVIGIAAVKHEYSPSYHPTDGRNCD